MALTQRAVTGHGCLTGVRVGWGEGRGMTAACWGVRPLLSVLINRCNLVEMEGLVYTVVQHNTKTKGYGRAEFVTRL